MDLTGELQKRSGRRVQAPGTFRRVVTTGKPEASHHLRGAEKADGQTQVHRPHTRGRNPGQAQRLVKPNT
ncbi:hypothetical protein DYI23_09690 [Roseibium polysiphoniae]|uniref:Uncharacterized protein n=1 Tax=Roseibium polysiphoniae TaxID=2571221 RepID=A0A944CCL7_9HYPH|nr:hypothetical protein [Roseibium polysiphoniae]